MAWIRSYGKSRINNLFLISCMFLCIFVSSCTDTKNENNENHEFALKYTEEAKRLPISINCCSVKFGVGDFNKDGFADIYLSASQYNPPQTDQNRIFINDGNGFFSDQTEQRLPRLETASIVPLIGDFDNDSDLDVFDGTFKDFDPFDGYQDHIFVNNGQGYFLDNTVNALPQKITLTDSSALADIDNDGDLDIFQSNRHGYSAILINNGSGIFHEENSRLPGNGNFLDNAGISGAVFFDADKDKSIDLFLTSYWSEWPNMLLVNNGKGFFSVAARHLIPEKIKDSIPYSVKADDFNKDGLKDIIIANNGDVGIYNQLLINMGNHQFSDMTNLIDQQIDINSTVSIDLGDFNKDGNIDFVTSNCCGFKSGKENGIALYENQGDGHFIDVTSKVLPIFNEECIDAKFLDVENDGDLDLVVWSAYTGAKMFINNLIQK